MEKMEKESLTAQSSPENPAENTPEKPELNERVGIAEAILFVTGNAIEKREMCSAMNLTEQELDETLDELESGYDFDRRGLRLLRFGQHVQLATRPDYAKYVEKLLQPVQKQSLSQAVMETLAVIAYRQPVTKAEIELIRGVKCDYSVQTLVTRGLIAEVGRKDALGRPDFVWHDGCVFAPLLSEFAGGFAGNRLFRACRPHCGGGSQAGGGEAARRPCGKARAEHRPGRKSRRVTIGAGVPVAQEQSSNHSKIKRRGTYEEVF